MKKIEVKRNEIFSFPQEVIKEYGFFEIRKQIEASAKIIKFSISDLMFFSPPSGDAMIRASEFQKMVLREGYVPLDSYCAKAIYENREALKELDYLWYNSTKNRRENKLDSIMFLGDIVVRDFSDVDHFSFFKFHFMSDEINFMPFEDDPAFTRNRDFILVFKQEFISKL